MMGQAWHLIGGQVLHPEGTITLGEVTLVDGRIVEHPTAHAETVDCTDLLILPGIVDLHGDAFEGELHPRPGVDIAFPIAMGSVDRQLIANGITTAFHGLTVSWEPGARSLEAARRFMAGMTGLRPNLVADHRVQLRWEVYAHDVIADLAAWLRETPPPAIAFNDHATETLRVMAKGETAVLETWARRAGVSLEAYLDQAAAVAARAADVPTKTAEVAALAQGAGAVALAHDEATAEDRAAHRALGLTVTEFPLNAEVAAAAVAAGEHVVMGGPNAIRGGSHKGFMSAEDAVGDGLCTVLASDYYYPSLLHAAERFVTRGVLDLAQAWRLISANPAEAMRLSDRGQITPGGRADLVVIDITGPWRIHHTIANGQLTSFGR